MATSQDGTGDSLNPAPPKQGMRWGQERRLEFIDYRLRWDGQINRSDLTAFFGISVPQASLDLSEYTKCAKGNLEYDTSTKVYRTSSSFKPVFASSSLERYLEDLLRITVNPDASYGSFLGWHPAVAVVPRPWRRLDTAITIDVVMAIRQSLALSIRYQSFSSSSPLLRTVTPHAMVNDGFRWHVRAYCHKNADFRDFLLSRILEVSGSQKDQERGHEDHAWNHIVKLVLAPHRQLKAAHRAVIELDYGMRGGECVLECRQALMFYVLQQLGLLNEDKKKSAEAQQITLKNRRELLDFLPQAQQR